MRHDIFVSYRRTDRSIADALVEKLRARGIAVWIDSHIEGGADWRETIVEALSNSDMLVILFTDECNKSRQLKKELAIADDMQKPVVPILLENTRPRGAYLYELADRNWIQAWPSPETHFDRIVEHLVLLCQKTSDGLSGSPVAPASEAPAEALPQPSPPATHRSTTELPTVAAPPTAPNAPASYVGKNVTTRAKLSDILPFRWIDLVGLTLALFGVLGLTGLQYGFNILLDSHLAPQILTNCVVVMAAYCALVFPMRSRGANGAKLNDILPFRTLDLIVLGPALIGVIVLMASEQARVSELRHLVWTWFMFDVLRTFLLIVAGYGAVVFPVRYFLRRLPLRAAIAKYLVSSLIILLLFAGAFVGGRITLEAYQITGAALVAAVTWLGCTIVAFAIYGALSGVRAMSSFRANLNTV